MAPANVGASSTSPSSRPQSKKEPHSRATSTSRSRNVVRAQNSVDSTARKRSQSYDLSSSAGRSRSGKMSTTKLPPSGSNLTVSNHPAGTRDLNLNSPIYGRDSQKQEVKIGPRKLPPRPVRTIGKPPVKAFPLHRTSHSAASADSPMNTPETMSDNETRTDLNGNVLHSKSSQKIMPRKSTTANPRSGSLLDLSSGDSQSFPERRRRPDTKSSKAVSQIDVSKMSKSSGHGNKDHEFCRKEGRSYKSYDGVEKSLNKLTIENSRSKYGSGDNGRDDGTVKKFHGTFVQAGSAGREVLGGRSNHSLPSEELTKHSVDQNESKKPRSRRSSVASVKSFNSAKELELRTETFVFQATEKSDRIGNENIEAVFGDLSGETSAVDLQEVNLSAKSGAVGLKNLGNTCFMNSILQCLSNTRPLLNYCLDKEYKTDIRKSGSSAKSKMMKVFAELMSDLWAGTQSSLAPREFKSEISKFAKQFDGYREQDAHEFLVYLLEALHEDINRVKEKRKQILDTSNDVETMSAAEKASLSWKHYLECDNSKITDIFVGQLKSTLTCLDCQYVSNTFEPFLALSLPLKKSRSMMMLRDCFKLFSQKEVLDKDNQPRCAKCHEQKNCSKQLAIHRFPKILIIHLMRFKQGSSSKVTTELSCPLKDLDLSEFATPESNSDEALIYDLYAVSNHTGSLSTGHYTANAKNPFSQQWHSFNDQNVSSLNLTKLESGNPYLLFYERREHLTR